MQEVKMHYILDRRHWKIGVIAIILIASIIAVVYLQEGVSERCASYSCFEKAMKDCKEEVVYINEEKEVSWRYEVVGKNKGLCDVEVELALAKEGELGITKLQGMKMVCSYTLGTSAYPEKNLDKCHGILKEELQKIVIDKLHKYIIENLGSFDDALNKK